MSGVYAQVSLLQLALRFLFGYVQELCDERASGTSTSGSGSYDT